MRVSRLFIFLLFQLTGFSQEKPKLIVGIVVDQMRYDLIDKYGKNFSDKGFKKLITKGKYYTNTKYSYTPTYTGPGHATIFTGTTPNKHGIVANEWFDVEKSKEQYCTGDPSVYGIGTEEKNGMMSPANMLIPTMGDELKKKDSSAVVIGIALKDRGAILPAGHKANAAYWFESKSGKWISSSYYMHQLPEWVKNFNEKNNSDSLLKNNWELLLPKEKYTSKLPDDNLYEESYKGETTPVFPHKLPELKKEEGYSLINKTPMGNTLTTLFAIACLQNEKLGKHKGTDMLTLSYSSTDYVGHQFGLHSLETEDTYIRLDHEIENLLSNLDSLVGKNNYLLFLTADHGAADNTTYLHDLGKDAGCFESSKVIKTLKEYLKPTFGDSVILKYINQQIYFNNDQIIKRNLNKTSLTKTCTDFLLSQKGVKSVYDFNATPPKSSKQKTNQNYFSSSYFKGRSGNLFIELKPNWVDYKRTGTTHSSSNEYDTHVPFIVYGWKTKAEIDPLPHKISAMKGILLKMLK